MNLSDLDCLKSLNWLRRLNVHYQPVKGYEEKITPERTEGFKRILKTITDHIANCEDKVILDIGSNLGYFCFKLTDLGARTIGVELNDNRVSACKCVASRDGYEEFNPQFVSGDVVSWVLDKPYEYDYVVLLNVFHHILLHNEEGGWRMFNKLINTSKGIFVMMRNSLQTWRLCDTTGGIPEAVLEASDATHYTAYRAIHGRVIYVFWRE